MEKNPALETLHFENSLTADTDEVDPTRGHPVGCDPVDADAADTARRPTREPDTAETADTADTAIGFVF